MSRQKIDEFGAIFRFITPILIVMIGFFLTRELNQINENVETLKKYQVSNSVWRQRLIRLIDKRFTRVEIRLGIEDGQDIEPTVDDNETKKNRKIREVQEWLSLQTFSGLH